MGNHVQSVCWSYWVNKLTEFLLFVFACRLELPVSGLHNQEPLRCNESSHIHDEIDSNVFVWYPIGNTFNRNQIRSKWENRVEEMLKITKLKSYEIHTISIRLEMIIAKNLIFCRKKIRYLKWKPILNQFSTFHLKWK